MDASSGTRRAGAPPWWLAEEVACKSCFQLHARTLEVHCEVCDAGGCHACVVVTRDLVLCGSCAARADDEPWDETWEER